MKKTLTKQEIVEEFETLSEIIESMSKHMHSELLRIAMITISRDIKKDADIVRNAKKIA